MAHFPCDLGGVAAVLLPVEGGDRDSIALDISGRVSADAVHQDRRCGKMDTEALLIVKKEVFCKIFSGRGRPRLKIVNGVFLKFPLDKIGCFFKCCGSMLLAELFQALQLVWIRQIVLR